MDPLERHFLHEGYTLTVAADARSRGVVIVQIGGFSAQKTVAPGTSEKIGPFKEGRQYSLINIDGALTASSELKPAAAAAAS